MENFTNKQTDRKMYLDVVKAFAIICVIWGHCIQYGSGNIYIKNDLFFEDTTFKIIYSFHMPLFMIFSGYLFAIKVDGMDWKSVILNRFSTLIIPIFLWAFVPYRRTVYKQIVNKNEFSMVALVEKYVSITTYNMWFLWAIFWCHL